MSLVFFLVMDSGDILAHMLKHNQGVTNTYNIRRKVKKSTHGGSNLDRHSFNFLGPQFPHLYNMASRELFCGLFEVNIFVHCEVLYK